ncbi:hypothetical protein [Oceanicola sp. D3]|uniref:hypothetical protein n=1 Tax=Oceanicola sp. D3 TaxID=2587163 RepID=UPI00143CF5D1|nr:hypothetical protein [Oceanicola sp. D3]
MGLFVWLQGSALGRTLIAAGGLLLAGLLFFNLAARSGARKERERAREADIRNAENIRRRVDAAGARRVRPEDILYRD